MMYCTTCGGSGRRKLRSVSWCATLKHSVAFLNKLAEVNEKSYKVEMKQHLEQGLFRNFLHCDYSGCTCLAQTNTGLTNHQHHAASCHQPKDLVPVLPSNVQQAEVLQPPEVLFVQTLSINVDLVCLLASPTQLWCARSSAVKD